MKTSAIKNLVISGLVLLTFAKAGVANVVYTECKFNPSLHGDKNIIFASNVNPQTNSLADVYAQTNLPPRVGEPVKFIEYRFPRYSLGGIDLLLSTGHGSLNISGKSVFNYSSSDEDSDNEDTNLAAEIQYELSTDKPVVTWPGTMTYITRGGVSGVIRKVRDVECKTDYTGKPIEAGHLGASISELELANMFPSQYTLVK
ncbi:MAG: hypothetical protein K0R14_1542 [Burkholderiales bacterium]|jgi:hypothetical protein|nr:hypothetical protein [Burkholderiales bacterium]